MSVVKMLCLALIITVISGCSHKESVALPQRCVVLYTPLPMIDNTPCDNNFKCIHDKCLKNYEAQKLYAQMLLNNSEVCK